MAETQPLPSKTTATLPGLNFTYADRKAYLEFKRETEVGKLNYIQGAVEALLGAIDKLKDYAEQPSILAFMNKLMGAPASAVTVEPSKKGVRGKPTKPTQELVEKVFDHFAGQEVAETEVTNFLRTQVEGMEPSWYSAKKRDVLDVMEGARAFVNKEKKTVSFVPKTSASAPEMEEIAYDNLRLAGVEPREMTGR